MTYSVRQMSKVRRWVPAFLVLVLLAASCSSRGDDDDTGGGGASDNGGDNAEGAIDTSNCPTDPTTEIDGDTIKLVSSYPQSGATAAFAQIGVGWQSYFEMVNADGGVDIAGKKYQLEWETKDDQYDSATTSTNIDELVGTEGDNAFAAFSVVGTANNLAIRDTLGDLCVPNLFAATGSPAWGNPDYPWTLGSTLPPYTIEAQGFVDLLKEQKPDAKVAMLIQDDDFGRAYEEGVQQAIEGTDIEVVKTESYQAGLQVDVSSQMTSLAASGANVFFNGATLLACPGALSAAAENNWQRDVTWVSGTCLSKTLMGLAGAAGDGVYSLNNIKDPQSPDWTDDEAMASYKSEVEKYFAGTDTLNGIVAYGWTQAAALVKALEAADAPTRLAVMESVRNLDEGDDTGLLLPGTGLTTKDPDDEFLGERVNLVQYAFSADGSHFERVGDVLDFEGETAEYTPEDLING